MRLLNPKALVLLALAALLAASLPASAQVAGAAGNATLTLLVSTPEDNLRYGETQVLDAVVEWSIPTAAAAALTQPIEVKLALAEQPAWAVTALQPTSVYIHPAAAYAAGSQVVRGAERVKLSVTPTLDAEAGSTGRFVLGAVMQATALTRASSTTAEFLLTNALDGAACTAATEKPSEDTLSTQSAGPVATPASTLAIAGVTGLLGIAGGALGGRLLKRK